MQFCHLDIWLGHDASRLYMNNLRAFWGLFTIYNEQKLDA